jgi:glycosyltransferase involved in cell wall biosynthesis
MLVSVTAPCLNEAGHIESFVREVFRQRLPDAVGLELLVADGGSKDGTLAKLEALIRAYPQLQVLQNPERITSCALNRCIRASSGEVIVRMDIHTTYAGDYIAECLAALDEPAPTTWEARG